LIKVDFHKADFRIEPKEIIKTLYEHGFRPEAIAYLLNLIFEALIGFHHLKELADKFSVISVTEQKINALLLEILDCIINEKKESIEINLEKQAENLDNILFRMKSRSHIGNSFWSRNIKNPFYRLKAELYDSKGIIDEKILKEKHTFMNRFNEVKNIARINRIIFYMVTTKNISEILLARYVQDLQGSINESNSINKASIRFDAIKDFIWMFTGSERLKEILQNDFDDSLSGQVENFSKFIEKENFKNFSKFIEKENEKKSLNEILKECIEKEKFAIKEVFLPLTSMSYSIEAKNRYDEVLKTLEKFSRDTKGKNDEKIKPIKVEIEMAQARSLLKLSKYSELDSFFYDKQINEDFNRRADFWKLNVIAKIRKFDYVSAKQVIDESVVYFSSKKEAKIIENLTGTNTEAFIKKVISGNKSDILFEDGDYLISGNKSDILFEDGDYYTKHHSHQLKYNILAIDGGGIRGIIPCVWLNEIEKQVKRPISHLFDMIAGTSTGAIIGAALTVPDNPLTKSKRPKFSSSDIFKIYIDHGKEIFEKRASLFSGFKSLFSSTYNDKPRSVLLEKLSFKTIKLKDTLCDLIVPAVNAKNTHRTFIFSTLDAKEDEAKNNSLYDVLMATTAAPTYFAQHEISNQGSYMDGFYFYNIIFNFYPKY
jgi:hypothetical protein